MQCELPFQLPLKWWGAGLTKIGKSTFSFLFCGMKKEPLQLEQGLVLGRRG